MYLKMDQSDSKENNIKIHYTFLYFTLFKIPMCVSRPAHRYAYILFCKDFANFRKKSENLRKFDAFRG